MNSRRPLESAEIVARERYEEDVFQWQCPRCGAMHRSDSEHCPCEVEARDA